MTKLFDRCAYLLVVSTMLAPVSAHAYIGPGMGAGVIGTILGILAGVLMLIVGIVWYPVKKLYKWIRRSNRS